ncbi:hypothetical protein D4Q52_14820 [Rhodopseudomonas palustris]|uniref:Uncharacterized protein n=1 Tax=Rhodopseudomonas palustris TaxID=1076 RepID=A0A418V444_RHOPL|nr:hypothetical protein D4Q52_14820 [Rhodopseudomonas palustris]
MRSLYDQFSGWLSGRDDFTDAAAHAFARKLKHGACNAVLLELGVDPYAARADVPVDAELPGVQILAFPTARIVRDPACDNQDRP